jgi:hypothetical protein
MERKPIADWPGRVPGPLNRADDVYAEQDVRRCGSGGCNGVALLGSRWCSDCLTPADDGELFPRAVVVRRTDALRSGQ